MAKHSLVMLLIPVAAMLLLSCGMIILTTGVKNIRDQYIDVRYLKADVLVTNVSREVRNTNELWIVLDVQNFQKIGEKIYRVNYRICEDPFDCPLPEFTSNVTMYYVYQTKSVIPELPLHEISLYLLPYQFIGALPIAVAGVFIWKMIVMYRLESDHSRISPEIHIQINPSFRQKEYLSLHHIGVPQDHPPDTLSTPHTDPLSRIHRHPSIETKHQHSPPTRSLSPKDEFIHRENVMNILNESVLNIDYTRDEILPKITESVAETESLNVEGSNSIPGSRVIEYLSDESANVLVHDLTSSSNAPTNDVGSVASSSTTTAVNSSLNVFHFGSVSRSMDTPIEDDDDNDIV